MRLKGLLLSTFVLIGLSISVSASAATFTVDDVGDAVDANAGNGACATAGAVCTLRAAIEEANALAGNDSIEFDITGAGPHTITLGSDLPAISAADTLSIDGCTETDAVANTGTAGLNTTLQIIIDGDATAANIFRITSDGNTINCLNLQNSTASLIELDGAGADSNIITGNFIGTNVAGSAAAGSVNNDGILIENGADSNQIGTDGDGTTDLAERNLISGNDALGGVGVNIADGCDSNSVAGNIIGLNAAGTATVVNGFGVVIGNGDNNVIGVTDDAGGGEAVEFNVIHGNISGLLIAGDNGDNATSTIIAGNLFGTNATGTAELLLGSSAIAISESDSARIGTDGDGVDDILERNVIAGAADSGIEVDESDDTIIAGNFIGTLADGVTASVIDGVGIEFIGGVTGAIVGANGDDSAGEANEGNIIANTDFEGIIVTDNTVTQVRISRNSIFNNLSLGIDLEGDGLTANDVNDADAGGNTLLNFPEIITATTSQIRGSLDIDTDPSTARVEVYVSDNDPNAFGEGQTFLGAVTPQANGSWVLQGTFPRTVLVTAITIDANNNTSEFSANLVVSNQGGTSNQALFRRYEAIRKSDPSFINPLFNCNVEDTQLETDNGKIEVKVNIHPIGNSYELYLNDQFLLVGQGGESHEINIPTEGVNKLMILCKDVRYSPLTIEKEVTYTKVAVETPEASEEEKTEETKDNEGSSTETIQEQTTDLPALPLGITAGMVVKTAGLSSVYYIGSDHLRHVYPTETVFFSHHSDFLSIKEIDRSTLEQMGLGKNMRVKAGSMLIKIQTSPKVYRVLENGRLEWIKTEQEAIDMYGADWAKKVRDIPESFWIDYEVLD